MLKKIFFSATITSILLHSVSFADNKGILRQADELVKQETSLSMKEALLLYEKVLREDFNNYEALWKSGESHYYLGTNETDNSAQKEYFRTCIEFTKKAVMVDTAKVDAHYFLGLCYGKYGEVVGMLKSAFLIDDMMNEMNTVISIEPSYSRGGAYRVLGRIYNKLPWIMGGDDEKSFEYLTKAVEYGYQEPLNHFFLAETALSLGKKQRAKQELLLVLEYTSQGNGGGKTKSEVRGEAENLLKKIFP